MTIEQILREENEDRQYYLDLLKDIESTWNEKTSSKYSCCLIGCLFETDKHRSYILHIKKVHRTCKRISCKFAHQCDRQFSSYDLLIEHIKNVHSRSKSSSDGNKEVAFELIGSVSCKCNMSRCSGRKFESVRKLMTHMNTVHLNDDRKCIFKDCETRFKRGSISNRHFKLQHTDINRMTLKDQHYVVVPSSRYQHQSWASDDFSSSEPDMEDSESTDLLYTEDELENINDTDDDDSNMDSNEKSSHVIRQYADFYNRLAHVKCIPHTTVQEIVNENLQHSLMSMEIQAKRLKDSLYEISGMTEDKVEKIVCDVLEKDDTLSAQRELSTQHKRNKYIESHFKFVPPVEVVLNKDEVKNGASKDVIHYVPIIESLKTLVEDKTFIEAVRSNRNRMHTRKEVISDVLEGRAFRENTFFKNNPGAYVGHLYSDGVEITNPIGAAKGKHKIVQVFYSLLQIPREQRSQVDRMQLLMIFKEKLVKRYGMKKLFQYLISDLLKLESGIMVDYPARRLIKFGLLVYSADNLEAHHIGGFSMSFSSKDICRFCHAQHSDLLCKIHDYVDASKHAYWTVNEYDKICDSLQDASDEEQLDISAAEETDNELDSSEDERNVSEDEMDVDRHGLRGRCPLNRLQSFHACTNLPPDAMHDLLEGVVAQDLNGIIRIFVEEGMFTIEQYNVKLRTLALNSHEASDRPQELIEKTKSKKLQGKAGSLWCHMRNFPLIIKSFVAKIGADHTVLLLAVKLHEMTNRISAIEFRNHEIDELEDLVIEYLNLRMEVFAMYPEIMGTAKPKHHFLTHYAQAIRLFGPPRSFWTARWESKHRVGKNLAEAAKNFRNITHTLSYRQQMRMASIYYSGMFQANDFVIPEDAVFGKNLEKERMSWHRFKQYVDELDLICTDIFASSYKYTIGDVVVISLIDGLYEMNVGLIQAIVIKDNVVWFIVKVYEARLYYPGYYETKISVENHTLCKANDLADKKPLNKHGTQDKFQFILHHHISFDNT